ncbi:MAG: zinc ABC transporter substrate-binding protein [Planctomycetes bacterium]|nr:zinc ABC transporter substrate-binding protein [Planctomycetota bacterium]
MKKTLLLIVLVVVTVFANAMKGISDENKRLNIVTTTSTLKSITEYVGGSSVDVKFLCQPDQDPHFIQAKPVFITWARKADLWIRSGFDLEAGYEQPIIEGSRNINIKPGSPGHLDASANVLALEKPSGQADRSMGDIHLTGNPHYWLDPYNARIIARNIAGRLAELLPGQKEAFEKNCAEFVKKIDVSMFGEKLTGKVAGDELWRLEENGKLDAFIADLNSKETTADRLFELGGWLQRMKPYKGMQIITFHRSWPYFANSFGLVVAGELEPKPGIPPSPRNLVDIIKKINDNNIKILLMENFYDRKTADFVAEKTGITVVQASNAVDGNTLKDYFGLIDALIDGVDKAFSK